MKLRRGTYQLEKEPIGAGTSAKVYASRDPISNRPVAVRIGALESTEFLAIDVMRYLTQPADGKSLPGRVYDHLIQLVDAGVQGSQLVTVMPLLDYTMTQALSGQYCGGLPDRETRTRWVGEMVAAMTYLVNIGIYHLDLKPDNLLLERVDQKGAPTWSQYRVVLADFGLVAYAPRGWAWTEGPAFTSWYRPLEEFNSKTMRFREDGRRIDESILDWAVGATGLEIMTGEVLFGDSGYEPTVYTKIERFCTPEGQATSQLVYGELGELEGALVGLMRTNPVDRPSMTSIAAYTDVPLPEDVQIGWTVGRASRRSLLVAGDLKASFHPPAHVAMIDFAYRYGDLLGDSATAVALGAGLEGRLLTYEGKELAQIVANLLALEEVLFLRRTRFGVAQSDQELVGFLQEADDPEAWASIDPADARTTVELSGLTISAQ